MLHAAMKEDSEHIMDQISGSPAIDLFATIADYFALASAAEGRGATTSQVLKHLAPSASFQAEASAK